MGFYATDHVVIPNSVTTIYALSGSAAEVYAKENGNSFVSIDARPTQEALRVDQANWVQVSLGVEDNAFAPAGD